MNDLQVGQVAMHKDLFDRCKAAIDNECYFEAVMLEYAAIEGRLEVMLSVLGLPCGRDCKQKSDIKISSRIQCLQYIRRHSSNFENSKLNPCFFTEHGTLKTWIRERDVRVHGLYKRPDEYIRRLELTKELAEKGLQITKSLYNDTRRLRRLVKDHPEKFCNCSGMCRNKKCKAYEFKENI